MHTSPLPHRATCPAHLILLDFTTHTILGKLSGLHKEICGDVNVNYLIDTNRRSQLDAILHSYNLTGIVGFPTRFGLTSQTAIDNIFIDRFTMGNYKLYPLINGLSDHDAQMLILKKKRGGGECYTYTKRKINKYTIEDFQLNVNYETWEQVFDGNDVN